MSKIYDNKEFVAIEKEYNSLEKEIDFYNDRIEELEKHDDVIEYLKYKKSIKDIRKKQDKLYKRRKLLEYSMCEHIIICSKIENDYREGRKYKEHTCILCGLTDSVVNKKKDDLTISDKIMLKYLNKNALKGKYIDVLYDPTLAHDVWLKVKKNHPQITDKELVELFEDSINEVKSRGQKLVKKKK